MMDVTQSYATGSDCYRAKRTITPKGIMVHSTATPGVMAEGWVTRWNKAGKVCPHAVLDDKQVIQLLPWNHRAWHCGGSGNDTHIAFEICEPKGLKYNAGGWALVDYDPKRFEAYFNSIWDKSVELCAMLCKEYNLTADSIICHAEGYQKGIAGNHADVLHWFPKHGRSMDDFRAAVKANLEPDKFYRVYECVQKNAFKSEENAKRFAEDEQKKGKKMIIE